MLIPPTNTAGSLKLMLAQRLPTTVILATLALIFSSASILNEYLITPLITVLIITQASSLIVAPVTRASAQASTSPHSSAHS